MPRKRRQPDAIAKVLAAQKPPPAPAFSKQESAAIAREHSRLLNERVKHDIAEITSRRLKPWVEDSQALHSFQREQLPQLSSQTGTAAALPMSNDVQRLEYRSLDYSLPGYCDEVRRLHPRPPDSGYPPQAFARGTDFYAIPADPPTAPLGAGEARYAAAVGEAIPDTGVLAVGAAAGHFDYYGQHFRFRTEPDDYHDTSSATASLYTPWFQAPSQARVTVSIDAIIELIGIYGSPIITPPVQLWAGNRESQHWGQAFVSGTLSVTIYSLTSASVQVQAATHRIFVSAEKNSSSDGGFTVGTDIREFSGNSAISASLRIPQNSHLFFVVVDAVMIASVWAAWDPEIRWAGADYRYWGTGHYNGGGGLPGGYSLMYTPHVPASKISIPEVRVTICRGVPSRIG